MASVIGEFDFVVVGAGSAGCVVAARLSESGKYTVALMEAGGEDDSFWIHAPLGYGKLYDHPKYNWLYDGEPEPGLGGQRTYQPRGKVLGGTSAINGSVYMRGQPDDFAYWRQLGNVGWSYEDVLPYYIKSEDSDRTGELRGVGGPLGISEVPRHELADAFIKAAVEAGYPRNDDLNGAKQEGFGYNQATTKKGRRSTTAVSYIHPIRRQRKNLNIILHAQATRLLFKDGRAVGVECKRNGETCNVMARREVILSLGAFNSPQLLELSGIGAPELLEKFNIPVVLARPGVGENLQDHVGANITYQCTKPITVNDLVNNPLRKLAAGIQYILFRTGYLSTTANVAAGAFRTDPALEAPDVKIGLRLFNRTVSGHSKERMGLSKLSSFTVTMSLMHPENRGTVHIKSADPLAPPAIQFNFLTSQVDIDKGVKIMHAVRKIMSMPSMVPYVAAEMQPGPACTSDEEMGVHFRKRAFSNHHPTGTCRMGIDDRAVVDPRLRVHGIGGLRVIDASIMPRIVGANPNASIIMIGEKGADMILQDAKTA